MTHAVLFDRLLGQVEVAPRHVHDERAVLHRELVEEPDGLRVSLPVPVGQQSPIQVS